jgi:hypothetical protein
MGCFQTRQFFDQKWVDFVKSCPHGRVVEVLGDHWMFHEAAKFVNEQITNWLGSF